MACMLPHTIGHCLVSFGYNVKVDAGEICFERLNIQVDPKQGKFIVSWYDVFSEYFRSCHQTRYIIVTDYICP